jgi:hypothetical protein
LLAVLPSDLKNLQSVGKEAYEARKELILRDDQEAVWNYVKTLKGAKVDIVLDNGRLHPFGRSRFLIRGVTAGFEVRQAL